MSESDHRRAHRRAIADETSPSRTAYLAVAAARGCDPLDLPPLQSTIDADEFDALVEAATDSEAFAIEFEHADCSVTVTATEVRAVVR